MPFLFDKTQNLDPLKRMRAHLSLPSWSFGHCRACVRGVHGGHGAQAHVRVGGRDRGTHCIWKEHSAEMRIKNTKDRHYINELPWAAELLKLHMT